MTPNTFNKIFDHTILKAPTTEKDLEAVCREAINSGFYAVAVNTGLVSACAAFLKGSEVKVDAAVGFPLGITTIACKTAEAEEAINNGADEIDYVLNVGKLKEGNTAYIREEMEAIVNLCRKYNVVSKVIFENCYLTDDEKIQVCEIARDVEPDFIKTSTGFGPSSATAEDVSLMKAHVGERVQVKAAGGIRTLEDCLAMLKAGATRIGCSASVSIAKEYAEIFNNGKGKTL